MHLFADFMEIYNQKPFFSFNSNMKLVNPTILLETLKNIRL